MQYLVILDCVITALDCTLCDVFRTLWMCTPLRIRNMIRGVRFYLMLYGDHNLLRPCDTNVFIKLGHQLSRKCHLQKCQPFYRESLYLDRWFYIETGLCMIFIMPIKYRTLKNYRKTSNISRTLVGNKIIDHSDVVGASPVGAALTTSSFLTW